MSSTVLIPKHFVQAGRDVLAKANINMIEVDRVNEATLRQYGDQIDGAVVMLDHISNDLYSKVPNLKILARVGVGYNNIDPQGAAAHGVWVTITPHANYNSVAEAILGAILMLSRDTFQRHQALMHDDWSTGHSPAGHEINGQTLGIIGYGRIGHALARKADALGMHVLVNNGSHHKKLEVGQEVPINDLLSQSDFVSLSAPVTDETVGMINQHAFKIMKSTASLINFGRGQLVVHDDLVDALRHHEIHSAALDAFDTEPLPNTDELLQLDNVFLTPHIGGGTIDAMNHGSHDAATEIVRVLKGQKPQWPVNQL